MKEILTIEKLREMKPHTIFDTGELLSIKWVAVRGVIWDWAIYYGSIYESPSSIASNGDKIFDMDLIKFLVPCESEAITMYRY